jgi:hypothetical protein
MFLLMRISLCWDCSQNDPRSGRHTQRARLQSERLECDSGRNYSLGLDIPNGSEAKLGTANNFYCCGFIRCDFWPFGFEAFSLKLNMGIFEYILATKECMHSSAQFWRSELCDRSLNHDNLFIHNYKSYQISSFWRTRQRAYVLVNWW